MRCPTRCFMSKSAWVAVALLTAVAAAPARTQQTTGSPGIVTGRVVDSLALPLPGARVSLDTLGLVTTADSTGAFRLAGVPAGHRTLTVRALGFAPASLPVDVAADATTEQTITLAQSVTALPTVKSQAVGEFGKPERLAYTMKYDEFYRRRSQSVGSGLFYTHEDLEKMKTADLPDMLRRVPGLRLRQDPDGTQLFFPGCSTNHILINLDGQRVWPAGRIQDSISSGIVPAPPRMGTDQPPGFNASLYDPFELIQTLHIQNIEAIEVYKNLASLPVEAANGKYCGAILIWTR